MSVSNTLSPSAGGSGTPLLANTDVFDQSGGEGWWLGPLSLLLGGAFWVKDRIGDAFNGAAHLIERGIREVGLDKTAEKLVEGGLLLLDRPERENRERLRRAVGDQLTAHRTEQLLQALKRLSREASDTVQPAPSLDVAAVQRSASRAGRNRVEAFQSPLQTYAHRLQALKHDATSIASALQARHRAASALIAAGREPAGLRDAYDAAARLVQQVSEGLEQLSKVQRRVVDRVNRLAGLQGAEAAFALHPRLTKVRDPSTGLVFDRAGLRHQIEVVDRQLRSAAEGFVGGVASLQQALHERLPQAIGRVDSVLASEVSPGVYAPERLPPDPRLESNAINDRRINPGAPEPDTRLKPGSTGSVPHKDLEQRRTPFPGTAPAINPNTTLPGTQVDLEAPYFSSEEADPLLRPLEEGDARSDLLSDLPGLLPLINPGFEQDPARRINCLNCSVAVDRWLDGAETRAGQPGSALSASTTGIGMSRQDVEDAYGRRFDPYPVLADVVAELETAGHGARAIVMCQFWDKQVHYFNVVNREGKVFLIDAQTARHMEVSSTSLRDPMVFGRALQDQLEIRWQRTNDSHPVMKQAREHVDNGRIREAFELMMDHTYIFSIRTDGVHYQPEPSRFP